MELIEIFGYTCALIIGISLGLIGGGGSILAVPVLTYLFTVNEDAFNPPPKVKSGVIRIVRNDIIKLDCDEKLFLRVVKAIFNQRRKMARNSLKSMLGDLKIDHVLLTKRPEQLSVENFIEITKLLESEIK